VGSHQAFFSGGSEPAHDLVLPPLPPELVGLAVACSEAEHVERAGRVYLELGEGQGGGIRRHYLPRTWPPARPGAFFTRRTATTSASVFGLRLLVGMKVWRGNGERKIIAAPRRPRMMPTGIVTGKLVPIGPDLDLERAERRHRENSNHHLRFRQMADSENQHPAATLTAQLDRALSVANIHAACSRD
jgi:hypothetical protein